MAKLYFDRYGYAFTLIPTADGRLIFADEEMMPWTHVRHEVWIPLGSGHVETKVKNRMRVDGDAQYLHRALSSWVVYHFHDTSDTAGVRRENPINDNEYCGPTPGISLPSCTYEAGGPDIYAKIRDVVRLAAPFFDDFKLRPAPQTRT